MTTDIFYEWFVQFTAQVTERPLLLLVYDGHLSHVSIKLIEQAISEDITLVKLTPHVTDLLQPLEICCFGPLKREWEKVLNKRINVMGLRESISKSTFVDLLASVWYTGLSPENVKAGFRATGIYPVDRSRYPTDRFDPRLVKRYDQWVKLGKPADIMEELALSISTPMKLKPSAIETQQDEQASQSNPTAKDVISSTPISSTLWCKSHLYVGKVMRRFLEEEGGPTKDLEINCLKPHVGSDIYTVLGVSAISSYTRCRRFPYP